MKLTLFNNSNTDVILKLDNFICKIAAHNTQVVDCNYNAVDIKLLPDGRSHLKRVGKTVVGYHFYVESLYHIVSKDDNCYITLNVIGIDGDHYEYYIRVVPSSENADICLKEYTIPDKQIIMESVISNYNQRQMRNAKNRKSWKKYSLLSDIVLDTIYSALPVIIFVYIFAHNHMSKKSMILLMLVIWAFVILLMQVTYRLFDKIKANKAQNIPAKKQFDIMNVFESSYIDFITSDKERYQNKK